MSERTLKVGDVVIFCDNTGNDHNAIVTTVWSPETINLVRVSANEAEQDQYGRQIKHDTSVPHMSPNTAHGYYFRYPDEEKKEYKAPIAR